jgi:hypothetical protein
MLTSIAIHSHFPRGVAFPINLTRHRGSQRKSKYANPPVRKHNARYRANPPPLVENPAKTAVKSSDAIYTFWLSLLPCLRSRPYELVEIIRERRGCSAESRECDNLFETKEPLADSMSGSLRPFTKASSASLSTSTASSLDHSAKSSSS